MTKNIPLHKVFMAPSVEHALKKTLYSGYIGEGPVVEEFEAVLGNYFGNPNTVLVNSGTSALQLALEMCEGSGDTILTTPLTCLATNTPIIKSGHVIDWVDVDRKTCNMDLECLERKIDQDTKAILVTHWGGTPNDMDEIDRIRYRYWEKWSRFIPIIEDCAHAFGAEILGRRIGSKNTCIFSFGPIKNLTCGDGGSITFEAIAQAERARKLRWYGIDRKNRGQSFKEIGHKFHMNDIAATIGLENFKSVLPLIKRQQQNALTYRRELANVPGITLLEENASLVSSYWLFTILVENRTEFFNHMKSCGIEAGWAHKRNDKYDCFKQYYCHLPKLDWVDSRRICIPVGWWMSDEDVSYVVNCIKQGW